jgi:hypothetical protein
VVINRRHAVLTPDASIHRFGICDELGTGSLFGGRHGRFYSKPVSYKGIEQMIATTFSKRK